MNSSLRKYNTFVDLKNDTFEVKPKVTKSAIQKDLESFFRNLKSSKHATSKSFSDKSARRNHQ
jgi:ribosomal protein L23